jgi:RNA polymerase sigma-70 factor, ECF subfamily
MSKEFLGHLLRAQARLYGYIRCQVASRADAEDILQETAAILWSKYETFQPGTNFLAWGYAAARNEIRRYYRRQARDRQLFSEDFLALLDRQVRDMDDELSSMQEALAGCLAKLRESDREVVQRCYARGTTVARVSEELGRPVGTLKNVLKRCRLALYECIRRTLAREQRGE